MPNESYKPAIDYRRLLSDAGSGLIAIVLFGVAIYVCKIYKNDLDLIFIRDLIISLEWIYNNMVNNGNAILAMIFVILFVSPVVGFIINAISYALLNDVVCMIVDCKFYQKLLKQLNVKNFDKIIEEFGEHFKIIEEYFCLSYESKKAKLSLNIDKWFDDIEDRLSVSHPDIIREHETVLGGYIMFRNFALILAFCIIFILISFNLNNPMVFGFFIILFVSIFVFLTPLKFLLLVAMPLLILTLPCPPFNSLYTPSWFETPIFNKQISQFGLTIAILLVIAELGSFLLSALALTYYHYHVFLAALYIASGRNWKCTDNVYFN